jgi:hypothetical protein
MQKFSSLSMRILVYDNRVDIRKGWFPFVRKQTIPFSSISSVEVTKMTRALVIHTNDGKKHVCHIGGFGKAQRCRNAIVEAM